MARRSPSIIGRSFTQMDRAFWCLHEYPAQIAVLAVPALLGFSVAAACAIALYRTWSLTGLLMYLVYAVAMPAVVLLLVAFLPLPCGAFVWRLAQRESPNVGDCFADVLKRVPRLLPVGLRLAVVYLFSFALAALPLLALWPRASLMPIVALFDDDRRIARRVRQLLKADWTVHTLAIAHIGVFVGLMATVFLPRILFNMEALATPTTDRLGRYLWAFELACAVLLAVALAVNWCLSLTLIYHEIRYVREGRWLRERIRTVHEAVAGHSALGPVGPDSVWTSRS